MKKFILILVCTGAMALLFSSCAKKCDCKFSSTERTRWVLYYPESNNASSCGDLEDKLANEYRNSDYIVECQLH